MTQNGTRKKIRTSRATPQPELSPMLANEAESVATEAPVAAPEAAFPAAQAEVQLSTPEVVAEHLADAQRVIPEAEVAAQDTDTESAALQGEESIPQLKESDPVGSFAPRNFLMPYLLLLLRDLNMHGYELWEKLTRLGFPGFNENDRATVYRALRQLEKEGKVASHWETASDGPARRVYSLTAAGQNFLEVWAAGLEQYRRTLDFFFSMYSGISPTQTGKAKTPAEAAASIWTAALDANPWTNPSLNPLLAPYTQKGRARRQAASEKDAKKSDS